MSVSRREFMGIASAAALAGVVGSACSGESNQSTADAAPTPSGDDPLGVRADFPAATESLYLNTPYIGPSPQPAVDKTIEFLAAKSRDPVLLRAMLEEEEAVREKFSRLIRAQIGEIGLVSSTSEGENIVVNSLDLKAGDNVVIDDLHYMTSLVMYSQLAETLGIETRIVRNVDGVASPEAFAEMVDENTKLISVAWISNRNGYRQDLKALADLAHAHGAYLYADAVQGVGMIDLDVGPTGVDFLTTGSYKWLLGGFGVAPFYVRESVMGRGEARSAGLENGGRKAARLPVHDIRGCEEIRVCHAGLRGDLSAFRVAGLPVGRRNRPDRTAHGRPGAPPAQRADRAGVRGLYAARQPVRHRVLQPRRRLRNDQRATRRSRRPAVVSGE